MYVYIYIYIHMHICVYTYIHTVLHTSIYIHITQMLWLFWLLGTDSKIRYLDPLGTMT